jgi:RNA polymerase sigma-70 factor (ECF subfamily)
MDTGDTAAERQKLERLEELLWVTQAQAGDSEAFARLMNRYEKRLIYYLRRIVPEGDWALDLHQEVWIDAFRGLPSLQVPEAFRVWIYRIAHRKAVRFIRNERLHEKTNTVVSESAPPEHELPAEPPVDAEAIHQALQLLSPDDRELLVLHYLRDLSTQELAVVLDCPAGTIKSRLYHARIALRRIIERKKL